MSVTSPGLPDHQMVWAIPGSLNLPVDRLQMRLDIYSDTILLHRFSNNGTVTRPVSAQEVVRAFSRDIRFASGVLPAGALWWSTGPEGDRVALWRKPQRWKVAISLEVGKPPARFTLPMPGLVFLAAPGRPPSVFAVKTRPTSPGSLLYHAPLFNVYQDGRVCSGTHRWPQDVAQMPESFFTAFFTRGGLSSGRSQRHPHDLLALWQELDGRQKYPLEDLVAIGSLAAVLGMGEKHA